MIDTRVVSVAQIEARIRAATGGAATADVVYVERFNISLGDPERVAAIWSDPPTAARLNRALSDPSLQSTIWSDPVLARFFGRVLLDPALLARLWDELSEVAAAVGLTLHELHQERVLALPEELRDTLRRLAGDV
jgi:hypothetical protein